MRFILDHKDTMMKRVLSSIKSGKQGIGLLANTLFHYKNKLLIILSFALLLLLFVQIEVLVASDYKTYDHLKSWPIKKGEEFAIEYTHSVQLTPVVEVYFIDKNYNIVLKESYFHSYGAGLPATTPYKFEITDRGFRIYDINQIMDDLVYRTGAVKANHKINIKDKTDLFLDFSKPREGVKFSIEKISLLLYLARR